MLKSVNILQSCTQECGCLVNFVRPANTLLNDEESARDNYVLACNFPNIQICKCIYLFCCNFLRTPHYF